MNDAVSNRSVLVTVGTDFHSFDRLVEWVDRWAASNSDCRVFVQHGSSRAPKVAKGSPFLTPDELHQRMASADIVVTHGGPATITEARKHGHLPVCVPRDPELGEHVDDHQQRFARFVGDRGLVRLVSTEEEFVMALASDLLPAGDGTTREPDKRLPEGVVRLGEIVTQLIAEHRGAR